MNGFIEFDLSARMESSVMQEASGRVGSIPVSVVILAKNESQNMRRCIEGVDWCDDIVVVDDGSTDATGDIAKSCGARVVSHKFESFATQRNWAMEHASLAHDWVLHLDADEVGTDAMRREIQDAVAAASDETTAFRMCRKTMLMGKWLKYSDGFPVWIMRLVRKGVVEFENSGHGEVAVPTVSGELGTIREPFHHYAFSKGLANWIERHNRYSTCEAHLEAKEDHNVNWLQLLSVEKAVRRREQRKLSRSLPFRPSLRFLYQYVFKLGFLDGRAGWMFSSMMATYESWIVVKKNEFGVLSETVPFAVPERSVEPAVSSESEKKAA